MSGSSREPGPLDGLRVIEIGQLIAGPFVGSRLADFGAEVIKVEDVGAGDPLREWGRLRYQGECLWWPVMGRGKKSVTADLRREEGRELLIRLVAHADALVENFKPGTLEKWGLGPGELHEINPGLIIVRISGFGQSGPYAHRPGFASVGEAMGGLRYINGAPGQPPPRFGISLGDSLTALFAFEGLMMALYWRDARGGTGQVIDASIIESCFNMLESALPEYDKLGVVREPSGSSLPGIAPSNIYPVADGSWIVISANLDPIFRRLCDAMGRPELAEEARFVSHRARGDNAAELDEIIAQWSSAFTRSELEERLNEYGVVFGPIYSIADLASDPHLVARDMIVRFDDPRFGSLAIPGIAPKLSRTPGSIGWLGSPMPGSHNEEVYGTVLGMDAERLAALRQSGVI